MSWDLNLCLEPLEKVLVPFHYFVEPGSRLAIPPSPLLCSFPFFRLPIDLQLVVYEQCDAPTLFQLMRTSLSTRRLATKLFWENTFPGQWYHCPDYGLFQHRIQTYIFTPHCPKFASRITNIEIDLIRLELQFQEDGEGYDERFRASTSTKATAFWAKVEKVFPSVKRVVLTGCTPRRLNPPPPGESDGDYTSIEIVVGCAPAHIKVHIAFVAFPNREPDRPPRNTLWRVEGPSAWCVVDSDWNPTRVLLPERRWTVSPLGDFEIFYRRYSSVLLEASGIKWLMIESYARYAIHGVIHCPRLDCSATYRQRELWKQHLSASGHGRFDVRNQSKEDPMLQLFCYKHTPETEKAAIEARRQRLDSQLLEAAKIQRRVGHGWGPPGSEQRRLFEQEFIAQIKEESLYTPEEPGSNAMSPIEQCLDGLWMWFDRRHVYHGCSGTDEGHICYGG